MRLPSWCSPPTSRRRGGESLGVVAVPGLGLSVDGWAPSLTLLASRLDDATGVAALALPAFGMPASRDLALDPVSSARRLIDRLDDLRAERVTLVGHSAGASVVAEAARLAPDRVSGLVLVGPAAEPRARTWPRLVGRWLRNAAHEPAGQVPLLVRDYTHSGLVGFARAMAASRAHELDVVLAGCGVPTLLVGGALDRISPPAGLERLAARCADAHVHTVPGAAHMLPVTHFHELVDAVHPFLRRTAGRPRA